MITFNQKETKFLETLEEARIATSHDDIPHVKPVSYVKINDEIIVATDYNTRTHTNIRLNQNAGIVIDTYKPGEHRAICIQGKAEIVENGPEFQKFYGIFYNKFEWVRKEPWKENEAPFLKIIPKTKISWGLD
ncbi:MAG: pyridoxamine 5'-phosphate oxidase family protein [Nitrosopumilus sp.]|nr:pyridoxamine 5'-phosphate oxidase family protein [Nitrosopumilus sp.]